MLQRDDVLGVAIATPVKTHFPLAKMALTAGKHVLLEKPMTASSAEAQELIDLAADNKRTLMVDHTFLYTGAVQKIAELIRKQDLGTLFYIDSVRVNLGLFQKDVDVIWDLAPHDLSIVNFLLHRPPLVVRAVGQSHTDSGLADVAYVNVDYGDNVFANFHVSWLSPTKIRHMAFSGSRRMVLWNDLEEAEKIRVYDRGIEVTRVTREDQYQLQIDYRMGDVWLPRVDRTEALRDVTGHFLECCQDKATCKTGGRDGLDVVLELEAAAMSLANGGRPVTIEGNELSCQ